MIFPRFTLIRYNPRRRARGAEAAEVKVEWSDDDYETLWMSRKDIEGNYALYGKSEGLRAAYEAYNSNVEFPAK